MIQQTMTTEQEEKTQRRTGFRPGIWSLLITALIVVALGVLIHAGITNRVNSEAALVRETQAASVQDVSATHPKLNSPTEDLVLPGNMQAFTDSPIFAR